MEAPYERGPPTDHPCVARPLLLKGNGLATWPLSPIGVPFVEYIQRCSQRRLEGVWGTLDECLNLLDDLGWGLSDPRAIRVNPVTGIPVFTPSPVGELGAKTDRMAFHSLLSHGNERFEDLIKRWENNNEELAFEIGLPSLFSRTGPPSVDGIHWSRWPAAYLELVGIQGVLPFEEIRKVPEGYVVAYVKEQTIQRRPLEIALALERTLGAIHAKGWVHRGVKHKHVRSYASGVYLGGFQHASRGDDFASDKRALGLLLVYWYTKREYTDLHAVYKKKGWTSEIPVEAHDILNRLLLDV